MFVMQYISLLQIAPTLAEFFGITLVTRAKPVEQILKFAYSRNPIPPVVVLVVIDSLDCQFYSACVTELEFLHKFVEQDGLLFECETVSNHTTPAIASILTGLLPESHGIVTSEDVGKSKINSILEILADQGTPTAAVMETNGTKPLLGRISYVFAVDDREDIEEYDKLIKTHTITALQKHEVRLVFAHLRSIDRFSHRGWDLRAAAKLTNENMRAIAEAVSKRKGMLLICGDHGMHLKNKKREEGPATVPLIVSCP
jgi:arylsulfatase A-like enzyme